MLRKKGGGDTNFREAAERRLKSELPRPEEELTEDVERLIHELRVHQIELEMRNEELFNAQVKLEESRTRYADLYDFAPEGYVIFDKNGLILEANLTAATQLGIERGNLSKKPFRLYVLELDRRVFSEHLRVVFKTQERRTCEVRLHARGGPEFYARLESIYIEDTKRTGMCRTSIIDISSSKLAEEALQRAHDELEKRVKERTEELAKKNESLSHEIIEHQRTVEELRKARDEMEMRVQERTAELRRSNQALDEFASVASHDMQEPLRKVIAFGNMLKRKHFASLGDGGQDYLDRMLKATRRMQSFLDGLLDYARLSTKANPFKKVELSALLQEVLSDLELRIKATRAEVRVTELPAVEADPIQMRQLFQNLVGNALKFHKEGEKPFIQVRYVPTENSKCRIIFEDNGIGFDEQYTERIFAPLQTLHGKSSKYEGIGLGLAICQKIVERHGGSITAQSTPGAGSRFIVILPLRSTKD